MSIMTSNSPNPTTSVLGIFNTSNFIFQRPLNGHGKSIMVGTIKGLKRLNYKIYIVC